uniref:Uncharacterized protein n=1 Tax=Corethron hystrix TaxID=216773 RepID=A0A6U5LLD1_9STRA|mmetsp:Transcript_6070/g.13065  ORF Transcript_6070/g.13065 Transcript_6070/m.13065 type:complete len:211 (+) Transcript_6070:910-1542(+)|eukprot:CAMPEP_0113317562 /NCGR_PEP_ID=MMETSP0010_2-20120614/12419_1 /TAXON_ID=216773 ORGANISM="Corethron hystrix, Strain 308" /NCGR_SAMPLE_ID=MMETSP0010_2 /ASSEMBLY_ACC=CAM_ASM_000155 /LENGTH=210 /DNA_ID=CAMNT_0000174565 /DNA_START=629 /DNA_END=1258 /DNA_ORIENTATION=- /assembly_acc=CAM_ASM_000155
MSPVHAVTQVHDLVVRIGRIHDRRCRIVAGLHVANARLERRRRLDEEGSMTTEEGGKKAENTMTPDRLVGDLMSMRDFLAIKEGGLTNTQQHKEHMDRLKSLNNWGVNHCLSSLKDLNMDMVRNMAPFYSVKFTSREMFYYEMFSFVVWKALKDYAVPVDVAQALQYRSCGDRLKIAYEKMLDHRLVLERIVEEKSQELVDCGEECVDLW